MTRRPASFSRSAQPGCRQPCSKEEPKPWISRTGGAAMTTSGYQPPNSGSSPRWRRAEVDELLAGFVNELRNVGFPVSLTENIDAAAAVQLVPIENREAVKAALAATLVKEFDHYAAFETVFDIYFSTRRLKAPDEGVDAEGGAESDVGGAEDGVLPGGGGGLFDSLTREELIELIYRAMRESDRVSLRALSVQPVRRHAGFQPGRPVAGTYYLFRTLKELGAETMYDRIMDDARAQGGGQLSIVEERLAAEESQERVDLLRREGQSYNRRRPVDDRGPDAQAQPLPKPLPADVYFLKASAEQIMAMDRVMQPLTRKLAA